MKSPDVTMAKLLKLMFLVTILEAVEAEETALTLHISGQGYNGDTLSEANRINVEFTMSALESFYQCLCDQKTQNCTVPFYTEAGSEFDTNLTRQGVVMDFKEYNMSSYYTCQVPGLYLAFYEMGDFITCNRIQMFDLNCSFSNHCFKVSPQRTCDLDSILLTWVSYQNVAYTVRSGSNTTLSACLPECNRTSIVSTTSGSSSASTTSVLPPPAEKSSDTDVLAMVVGLVVAAIVVIAIIVIAVIVQKRKSKRRNSSMTKDITGPLTFGSDDTFTKASVMTQAVMSTTNTETSSKVLTRNSLDTVNNNRAPITAHNETIRVVNGNYELATLNVETEQGALSEHKNNNRNNSSHRPIVFGPATDVSGQRKNSINPNEVKAVCLDSETDQELAKDIGVDSQVKNNLEPNEVVESDSDDDYQTFKGSKKKMTNPYNVLLKPKEDPKGRAPMSTPAILSSPLTQIQSGTSGIVAGKECLIDGTPDTSGLEIPEIIEVKPDLFKTDKSMDNNKKSNIRAAFSDDYDYPTFGQVITKEEEIYTNPDDNDDDDCMYSFTNDDVPEATKPKVESDDDSDYSDVDVKNSTEIPDDDTGSQTYYYSENKLEAKDREKSNPVSDTVAKISSDIPEDDAVSQTYYYSQNNLLAKTGDSSDGVLENSEEILDCKVPESTQGVDGADANTEENADERSEKVESVRGENKDYEDIGSVRAEFQTEV